MFFVAGRTGEFRADDADAEGGQGEEVGGGVGCWRCVWGAGAGRCRLGEKGGVC